MELKCCGSCESGSKTLNSYSPGNSRSGSSELKYNPKFTSTSEQLLGIPVEEVDQGTWRVHEGIGHTLYNIHVLEVQYK